MIKGISRTAVDGTSSGRTPLTRSGAKERRALAVVGVKLDVLMRPHGPFAGTALRDEELKEDARRRHEAATNASAPNACAAWPRSIPRR